jgi:hypothetical protein
VVQQKYFAYSNFICRSVDLLRKPDLIDLGVRSQHDLFRNRQLVAAIDLRPTGQARHQGVHKLDVAYLQRQSLWFDIRILWLTFVKVLRRDGVSH